MKGIRKGLNKFISQVFVVKEDEIEIGCPTDVKHLGHIGFDDTSGSSNPSWMNTFEPGPNFALSSIGASGSSLQPLSSRDLERKAQRAKNQEETVGLEASSTEDPPRPRKQRRRKNKSSSSTSSPRAGGSVKTRSSSRKPKPNLIEENVSPTIITLP